MKYCSFCLSIVLSLLVSSSVQGQTTAEEPVVKLPANLLDLAYVDLRNGFSIRPPLGFLLGSTQNDDLPDLIDWPQLKVPSSKRLVSFSDAKSRQRLTVYLLVTRKEMTIEQALESRQSYWQTFPDQATLQEATAETVRSSPAVVTRILWKGAGNRPPIQIRETLVQRKKDRYFMLVSVGPVVKTDDAAKGLLDAAIAGSFVSMDESEIKQRVSNARKVAQSLLEPLDSTALKGKFEGQDFYRIRFNDQEVGFRCVTRNVRVLADQKEHRFKLDTLSYLDSAEAAEAYAELDGWRVCAMGAGAEKHAFVGPVRFESHLELDGGLKAERFSFNATDFQQPPNVYCESGEWKEKQVSIFPCQAVPESEGAGVKPLKVTSRIDKIYLPLSLVDIVGELIEPAIGNEYVFARYFYRTLGFYSLRVVDTVELKLEPLPVGAAKPEPVEANVVKVVYLVGQLNSQGPIVEIWIDEAGRVVKQKAGGIELVRASRKEIQQRWPKPFAELHPEKAVEKKKAVKKVVTK